MNWSPYGAQGYNYVMLNYSETYPTPTTRVPAHRFGGSDEPKSRPDSFDLSWQDSWFACAFLSLYVVVYLAAGFASVAAVEWAWTVLFS